MKNSIPLKIRECTNCGAPIQLANPNEIIICEYCGSVYNENRLDVVVCPKCKSPDQTEKVSLIFNRSPVTTNYHKHFHPPQKPVEPYKFKEIKTKFPIRKRTYTSLFSFYDLSL